MIEGGVVDDEESVVNRGGVSKRQRGVLGVIMGYGEELKITKTYRNSQEVIDIAGSFIQKNTSQIKKLCFYYLMRG